MIFQSPRVATLLEWRGPPHAYCKRMHTPVACASRPGRPEPEAKDSTALAPRAGDFQKKGGSPAVFLPSNRVDDRGAPREAMANHSLRILLRRLGCAPDRAAVPAAAVTAALSDAQLLERF